MNQGLATVIGMTIAYAASLLGLVLAWLSYRKRHGLLSALEHILLDFEGRINRATFWLYILLLNVIWFVGWLLGIIVDALLFEETQMGVFVLFFAFFTFLVLWPTLALHVKRCHDLNRPGWFFFISLIPFVNIWYFIEIGFLRGTVGDNRFGPDPLASRSQP